MATSTSAQRRFQEKVWGEPLLGKIMPFSKRAYGEATINRVRDYEAGKMPGGNELKDIIQWLGKNRINGDVADSALDMISDIAFGQVVRQDDVWNPENACTTQPICIKGLISLSSGAKGVPSSKKAFNALVEGLNGRLRLPGIDPEVQDSLKQVIESSDDTIRMGLVKALEQSMSQTNFSESAAKDIYKTIIDTTEDKRVVDAALPGLRLLAKQGVVNCLSLLSTALVKGGRKSQLELAKLIKDGMNTQGADHSEIVWANISKVYLKGSKNSKIIAKDIMESAIERAGLDIDKLLDVWMTNATTESKGLFDEGNIDRLSLIGNSMKNITELEKICEGGARYMHETYNFHVFARYYPSTMKKIKEMDELGIVSENPSMAVQPFADYNGAWLKEEKQRNDEFVQDLGGRIYECRTKSQLMGSLDRFVDRFGKIKILVLGGHGSPLGFSLGNNTEKFPERRVTTKDIKGEFGKHIGDCMADEGEIFMQSCSTAKNIARDFRHPMSFFREIPGVVKLLSIVTGKKTTGPISAGNMLYLGVSDETKSPFARYDVSSRTYIDGNLIGENQVAI